MPKKATHIKTTYDELNRRLDELIAKMQNPNVTVDDAIDYYESATKLIEQLERYLEQAENRVEKIRAQFGEDK